MATKIPFLRAASLPSWASTMKSLINSLGGISSVKVEALTENMVQYTFRGPFDLSSSESVRDNFYRLCRNNKLVYEFEATAKDRLSIIFTSMKK